MEESLRQEFALCDHSFWERMEPPGDNDDQPKAGMDNETNSEETQQNQPQEQKDNATPLGSTDPKEEEWKENAKRIESDMETSQKTRRKMRENLHGCCPYRIACAKVIKNI